VREDKEEGGIRGWAKERKKRKRGEREGA